MGANLNYEYGYLVLGEMSCMLLLFFRTVKVENIHLKLSATCQISQKGAGGDFLRNGPANQHNKDNTQKKAKHKTENGHSDKQKFLLYSHPTNVQL